MHHQLLTRYNTCVDLDRGSAQDGATIQNYQCWPDNARVQSLLNVNTNTQRWRLGQVSANGGTLYEIISQASGKCLSVENSSLSDGARIKQATCTKSANQLFVMSQEGIRFRFQAVHSGRCLDLNGGHADNGNPFIQWACLTGNANQLFLKVKTEEFTPNHWYQLRQAGGKCVDIDGSRLASNGVVAQLWECWGGAQNQLFQFVPFTGSGGPFQIKVKGSGKCLDVTGAGSANGVMIQQYACGQGYQANQLWNVEQEGPFTFLKSVSSGKCLDLKNGTQSNGAVFHQWDCNHGNNNQRFILELP
ncbi:MAG: hypothetical protein EBX52_04325 [Proteobacteria bacterium]|nr:hypothetical protein [Pseudomonadota bacterium]